MAVFADTHTHLYLDAFDEDRDEAIKRTLDAGVTYLFLPNIDASTILQLRSLTDAYPGQIFGMMGLHPTSVKHDYREQMGMIEMELKQNRGRYCAIGEIGIDLYWDKTYQQEQETVFRRQLDLAVDHGLPVVIHTRNSFEIAIRIIEEKNNPRLKGIFHCFGGSIEQALKAVELGFILGIGGIITYKNSGLQKVVEVVGLDHMVLETDAPFLPPVPHRGERNESSYIPFIAKKIAEIKKTDVNEVAEITTKNALTLFGIRDWGLGTGD